MIISQKIFKRKKKKITFRDAYECLWKPKKKGILVTYKQTCSYLERWVLPKLGKLKLKKITPMLVAETVQPLAKEKKFITIKACLMRINEILELCVCVGILKYNRCKKIQKLFPVPKSTPHNYINAKYLHLLFLEVLKSFQYRKKSWFLPYVLFHVYSMLRPNEVASIKWEYIDIQENKLTIPAYLMKKRREFSLHIHPEVMKLLQKIRKDYPSKDNWVFPFNRNGKHISKQYLAKWLHDSNLRDKLSPHGLRSTARTFLKDINCPYEIAEDCLSHLQGTKTNRAYIRGDYYNQRIYYYSLWWEFIKSKLKEAMDILKAKPLEYKVDNLII